MNQYAVAPEGCFAYFTAGKHYKIKNWESDRGFHIDSDDGEDRYCLTEGCAHLRGGSWEITTTGETTMTPCEKLGYKAGDEFETLEGSNYFKIGERVKLEKDDGSYLPRFTNGKKSRHLYLDNVRPLAITLRPGDYVSTDGITEDEYHAVAAAFMAAGARPLEYPNLIEMREQLFFGWAVRPCGQVKGLWHSGNLIFHRDGRHLTISQVLNATNAPGKTPQQGPKAMSNKDGKKLGVKRTVTINIAGLNAKPQQEPAPMTTIDTLHEAKRQRDEAAEKLETAEAVLNVALDAVQTELGMGFIIKEAGDSDLAVRALERLRSGEDMNDPANWRAGDVVRAKEHSIDITEGREYVIAYTDLDGDIYIKDDAGDVEERYSENFTFVRRP